MESPVRLSKRKDSTDSPMKDVRLEFKTDQRFSLTAAGMNHRLISHISEMVCILNKRYFYHCLLQNDQLVDLSEIRESSKLSLYDCYGRTSFFYVTFGSIEVPVYQPGTLMFSSAAKGTSKSAKFDPEGQQLNGLILGQRDAVYLAAFVSTLAHNYRVDQQNKEKLKSPVTSSPETAEDLEASATFVTNFDISIFESVLQHKLQEFSQDDQNRFGGRLIEYRDIFAGIDEGGDVAVSVDWKSSYDPNDEYLRNWRKFFVQKDPVYFESKAFEVVKNLLLNTKGIFDSARRYSILESSMDVLIKFMRDNYVLQGAAEEECDGFDTKIEPFSRAGTIKEVLGNGSEVAFRPAKNHIPEVLKQLGYDYSIDISQNEFLTEYFLSMKKYLASLFMCSIIDHQGIFVRKDDSLGVGIKSVCALVPMFGNLIKIAGIAIVSMKDMTLRKKLSKIADLALNYSDLPDKISRLMAILRANAIMGVSDVKVKIQKTGFLSEALLNLGIKSGLSEAELMAFNDAKITEGVILVLIETRQINVVNFPDINELQQKIIEVLVSTGSLQLALPRSNSSLDEKAAIGKRFTEIIIDEGILKKNDHLPRSLLRKKAEAYEAYYQRVNAYLKALPVENLRNMLVKIDPLEARYRPTITLVLKRIEKKEKCTLI